MAAGSLPEGYAALPTALRTQTREAADAIERRAGAEAPTDPTTGSDSSGGSGGPGGDSGGSGGGGSGGGTGGDGVTGGAGDPSTSPSATESAASGAHSGNPSTTPAAAGSPLLRTPAWALGAVRYALLIALVAGLTAAVCGPLLPRAVPRLAVAMADWRARDRQSPVRKR
ncbi:hypothetical protein [Streptomyces sp. NPDC058739]|uniref:hypothetical protein n=1 Tax=Streptomyces sp. NPDC058739 TaxID=3346618 RepID=UPI003674A8E5